MAKYVKTDYAKGVDITPNKEYVVKKEILGGGIGIIENDSSFETYVTFDGKPSAHLDDVGVWTVINR